MYLEPHNFHFGFDLSLHLVANGRSAPTRILWNYTAVVFLVNIIP